MAQVERFPQYHVEELVLAARQLVVDEGIRDVVAVDRVLEGVDVLTLATTDPVGLLMVARRGIVAEVNDLSEASPPVTVNYRPSAKAGEVKIRKRVIGVHAVEPATITVGYLAREYTIGSRKISVAKMSEGELLVAAAAEAALGRGHMLAARVLKEAAVAVKKYGVAFAAELPKSEHERIDALAQS